MKNQEYDHIASFYDLWATADPYAEVTFRFYLDLIRSKGGSICEIGVGTGRIAIPACRFADQYFGIDISSRMIVKGNSAAVLAGVAHQIQFIHGDARVVTMPHGLDLICIPFRTIGHFISEADKKAVILNCFQALREGGKLVFDHYVFDRDWACDNDGRPRLMYAGESGPIAEIWDTYDFDYEKQEMHCIVRTVRRTRSGYRTDSTKFAFSWVSPEQMGAIVSQTEFEVADLWGDFVGNQFDQESSENQVWFLRKP